MAVNDSSNTDFIFCSFLFLYINAVWFTPYRKQPVFLNTPLQKKKQLKKKKEKVRQMGFLAGSFLQICILRPLHLSRMGYLLHPNYRKAA